MKLRTLAASLAVAVIATVPLAGAASAQPDRNCEDFATQADAQAALEARPGDPEQLDGDDDGYACESHFGEPTGKGPTGTPTPTPTSVPATTVPATTVPATTVPPTTVPPTAGPSSTPSTTVEPSSPPSTTTAAAAIILDSSPGQVRLIPRGGVATGDGTGTDAPPLALGGAAALAAAVTAGAGAASRRAARRSD